MIEIKAPVFPESIADGEVAAWHVEAGELVQRDQVLVDIETDKVVLEVVAPAAGKVTTILKQVGETVLAEEVLAHFEADEGKAAAAPPPAAVAPAPAVKTAAAELHDVQVSPAARKIADENRIDLARVSGTGKGGRIMKEDV